MSTASRYLAIAAELRKDILSGKYAETKRFPSEEALARRFDASRPTVERALRELKREGLLESRSGSGSFLTMLARNAAGALGIIAPDYRKIDFFTGLCDSILLAGRAAGYDVFLGDVSAPDASDRARGAVDLARAYADRRAAGVFLEPVDLVDGSTEATQEVLRILTAAGIPVVLLDRDYLPPPTRSDYDLIGIDNFAAGYRVARHLLDCGARRICFLTQPNYAATIQARIHGVAQAVIDAGKSWRRASIIETDPSDLVRFRRLMKGPSAPDAFVCRNDPLAASLLQTLAALRIPVPRKVRLAGFDDGRIARYLNPPLTTIRQPVKALAETAVASLLQRIRTPDLRPRAILLDAPLVVRASTANPNGPMA